MSPLSFLKTLHKKIPLRIQKLYMPFASLCSYRIQKYINFFYPPVFIFEGLEKNSKSPLVFAYAGFDTRDTEYWAYAVLAEGYRKHAAGRHFLWALRAFLKKHPLKCNFFLVGHNKLTLRYLSLNPGFRIPYWINMEIDTTAPFKELLGRQRVDMQRKIRKYALTYTISQDRKCFDDFYYNMFLPYIKDRHDEMAFLGSYEELLQMFRKGGLILVKKENLALAGGLFEVHGRQVRFRKLGVREGKWEYVRFGALGAVYYYLTVEMKKRGCTKIRIGGTRPLLSDGITRYKMSLDSQLDLLEKHSCLWLAFLKGSEGLKSFLINNPFIFFNEKDESYRAIFIEAAKDTPPGALEEIAKSEACGGIKGTRLFVFGGPDNLLSKNTGEQPQVFCVRSAQDLIAQ